MTAHQIWPLAPPRKSQLTLHCRILFPANAPNKRCTMSTLRMIYHQQGDIICTTVLHERGMAGHRYQHIRFFCEEKEKTVSSYGTF